MKSFNYYIKHPKDFIYRCLWFIIKILSPIIPAKIYLKIQFWLITGEYLNLKNPQSFNEKIQWLKLYDRNPKYTKMVDKYLAKEYVKWIIWKEHIIPTLWVWKNFDDIDFNKLPNQFVLKCTHDSWSVIICKDKKNFNKENAKNVLQSALKHNYYHYYKERAYKNVEPRIIAEEYIMDNSWNSPMDYKIFCFNWEAKAILIDVDRFSNHKQAIYDINWNLLPFVFHWQAPYKSYLMEKNRILNKMIEFAEILSKNIPQVRVDFYLLDKKIFFWELTFYHWAWITKFHPHEYDLVFWNWIKLPHKNE